MRFLAALQFLTIIPWRRSTSQEELAGSAGYFPVVGVVIGLILAGLNRVLGWLLPSPAVNVLLVASLVVITGALHLDGLVDTCDGVAGVKTAEERQRVMHDSRAGAFGVIGASLLLLVKYVSLNSVPGVFLLATLVLMPIVSRWAMVYAIFAYPYGRPSGLGQLLKQGTGWQQFAMATLITLAAAIVLLRLAGVIIMVGVWVIAVAVATYLKGKLSGLTGDTYGAINEVSEVGAALLVSVVAHFGII